MRVKTIVLSVFIIFFINPLFSDSQEKPDESKLTSWLMLGPAPVTNLEKRILKNNKKIANYNYLDVRSVIPEKGKRVRWNSELVLEWKKVTSFEIKSDLDSVYYFATYPDVFKRLKATLVVRGLTDSFIDVFMDGVRVKKELNKKDGILKVKLDMLNSKHIILMKVFVPGGKKFTLDATIENGKQVKDGDIRFSTDLYRRVNFRNILNMARVSGIRVSPDGRLVFLTVKKTLSNGDTIAWNEILEIPSGRCVYSSEGTGTLKGVRWLNDSGTLSFRSTEKETTSIYKLDIKTGERGLLLKGVNNFSNYWWSSDNSFLIYTKYKKKKSGKGFKYINNIPERAKSPVYMNSVYLFYPEGNVTHKIGSENDDFGYVIISPDSKKVLLQKSVSDSKNRPYYKSIYHILDMSTFSMKKLFESNFVSPRMWLPDSKKILFVGGPSSFNGIGNELPENIIPNDYDNQVFLYDLTSRNVTPLTKSFNPSVNDVFWSSGKNMFFSVTEGSYENLYKYDIGRKRFKKIDSTVDVTGRVGFSDNGKTAVFWGSGSTLYHKLYSVNLLKGKTSVLKDYNKKDFKYVKFGKLENWDHVRKDGKMIHGRVYYPVDFDVRKKYPCIVYYYGGTSPVERSFGGRYPFNWYAANGYVVYVLQPSGTVGYGQRFSAVHVNDWGKTTSGEIIEATKEFLKSHPFVDPGRVGAMGASYGGFLTQYLATQTDIFSAFISHAGISALSSYWGVGDWGYTYSGIATANSFPWNRKDIYVERSPLFLADKITTPLLLLHGDVDNNVPPGESYQMFAALKLLGKEVSLITFEGQAHWILNYRKRVLWMKTIIAWFDKWLKKDSVYWNGLYKEFMDSGK